MKIAKLRQGEESPKTLFWQIDILPMATDPIVGFVDTEETAKMIVDAVNQWIEKLNAEGPTIPPRREWKPPVTNGAAR